MAEDKITEHRDLDSFKDTKMLGITVLGLQHIQSATEALSVKNWPDFLKNSPATVIFQLDKERFETYGGKKIYDTKLIAANLHGHSEGGFVIVQDVKNSIGPWVLDEETQTFYLQDTTSPHLARAEFMNDAPNPLKIGRVYYGVLKPSTIMDAFNRSGFTFINKPMSRERWDIVESKGYLRQR